MDDAVEGVPVDEEVFERGMAMKIKVEIHSLQTLLDVLFHCPDSGLLLLGAFCVDSVQILSGDRVPSEHSLVYAVRVQHWNQDEMKFLAEQMGSVVILTGQEL